GNPVAVTHRSGSRSPSSNRSALWGYGKAYPFVPESQSCSDRADPRTPSLRGRTTRSPARRAKGTTNLATAACPPGQVQRSGSATLTNLNHARQDRISVTDRFRHDPLRISGPLTSASRGRSKCLVHQQRTNVPLDALKNAATFEHIVLVLDAQPLREA